MARSLVLLTLVLCGLFLIALPDFLERGLVWSEISKNAGLAILVAASIALFEPILSRWVTEQRSDRQHLGLIGIARTRLEVHDEIAQHLRTADKVKIVSTCLAPFLASHKEKLIENLRHRATRKLQTEPIRMVLVDPDSGAIVERATLDRLELVDKQSDSTLSRWVKGIEELLDLANKYPSHMKILLSPLAAPSSVFILDDHLYVTPYIFGERGSTSFCYHYTKGGPELAYNLYDGNFERYWSFLEERRAGLSQES